MAAILFVSGNNPLTAGNVILRDKLVAEGHTVTVRYAWDANKSTTGFDAAVLGSDCSSGDLAGYLTSTAGLMVTQHASTDDALMWTPGAFMSSNAAVTDLVLINSHAVHTLSGLSGTLAGALTSGKSVRYLTDSNMVAGAVVLARWASLVPTDVNVAAWAIETGTMLSDGTTAAPGRRIYAPPLSESADGASTDLLEWWAAGVAWAAGATVSDTTPPTAPSSLSESIAGDDVTLSWTTSTDDVGVTGYKIYRDTTPGFTINDPGNLIGTSGSVGYGDNNLPAGTYYYKVTAVDAADNESAASNEIEVVIAPATTNAVVDTSYNVTLDASGSTGGGTLSYSFTQVSGPTVTLSGTGASRTFELPTPLTENIVIDVEVTGSEGTDTQTITITPTGSSAAQQEELIWDAGLNAWV